MFDLASAGRSWDLLETNPSNDRLAWRARPVNTATHAHNFLFTQGSTSLSSLSSCHGYPISFIGVIELLSSVSVSYVVSYTSIDGPQYPSLP